MKSVLIVEDEILIAMEIERVLLNAGYSVTAIAADQAEALAAARDAELAFVDINLRDGPTGPQIARELAAKFGVRIVYVTANPAQIGEPAVTWPHSQAIHRRRDSRSGRSRECKLHRYF